MPTLTKEEFEVHIKELDKAIERAKIVLAHRDQPLLIKVDITCLTPL